MIKKSSGAKVKEVCILQRVCTTYRAPLFNCIADYLEDCNVTLLFGDSLPKSKVKNISDFSLLKLPRCKFDTKFFSFFGRQLVWHCGLFRSLRRLSPEVIITEGESHILSVLVVFFYKYFFDSNTKVVFWTLGGLPDEENMPVIKKFFKRVLYLLPNKLLVYSSFGKESLIKLGVAREKIVVAPNVTDIAKHLKIDAQYGQYRDKYREELNFSDKVVALYVGDIGAAKGLEKLSEIAKNVTNLNIEFVIVGDGIYFESLKKQILLAEISNIKMTGRVSDKLYKYYIASDLFILPGRGGMVIGEAMSYALPVVLHAADGTEYDLIDSDDVGVRLSKGDSENFSEAVAKLASNSALRRKMGELAKKKVANNYSIEKTAKIVADCVRSISA